MNASILATNPENFIFAQGDDLKTTSLKIAEAFGKLHKHVLRDIERIISQTAEMLDAPKFGLVKYEYKNNRGNMVEAPMYEMNQDGLVLVVMGYTGIDAMAIKVRYINAFNFMRAKLFPKTAYALRELPTPKYLTPAMLKHINRRVAWLVKNQVGATFPALGKLIQDTFNVNKREFVPYEKYREVCALLDCEPDEKALQGELLEPAKLEYQPPAGMALVDVAELETLRREKPFQIFKADNGLMQYTAEDLDNNQFAMIPMDKWEDLSQVGSFADGEKLVQVKSGQVIKMEDFIEQIFQDPRHPYVIAKRDVMTSIRTLFNSLL